LHELSVCAALVRQVLDVVPPAGAGAIGRIMLRIGPLAGVEPEQLRLAFPLVAAGTACAGAMIDIEPMPVRVCCRVCGEHSAARANRLLCAGCGAWQVALVGGDEMLLASVEFLAPPRVQQRERADV